MTSARVVNSAIKYKVNFRCAIDYSHAYIQYIQSPKNDAWLLLIESPYFKFRIKANHLTTNLGVQSCIQTSVNNWLRTSDYVSGQFRYCDWKSDSEKPKLVPPKISQFAKNSLSFLVFGNDSHVALTSTRQSAYKRKSSHTWSERPVYSSLHLQQK